MFRKPLFLILVAALGVVASAAFCQIADYEGVEMFSVYNGNPNGPWTYGRVDNFNAGYALTTFTGTYDVNTTNPGSDISYWTDTTGFDGYIVCNQSNNWSSYHKPKSFSINPARAGKYSVIRFTLPADAPTGNYYVYSFWRQQTDWPSGEGRNDASVALLLNGEQKYSSPINYNDPTVHEYKQFHALQPGDTVDYAVGCGVVGWSIRDWVKAQSRVCQAPSWIEGTVTASATGQPVDCVVVTATNPGQPDTHGRTDDRGRYFIPVYPGDHVVTATYFSSTLRAKTIAGVTTTADQGTTLNISLDVGEPTNFYVNDATGDDSYDGKSNTYTSGNNGPWKTINGHQSSLVSGDIVNVAPGVYPQPDWNGLVLNTNGVTFRKDAGAGSGKVTIDMAGVPGNEITNEKYGIRIVGLNNKIEGFEVKNATFGINLNQIAHEAVISGCEIHGMRSAKPLATAERGLAAAACAGIRVGPFTTAIYQDLRVQNNLIYDIGDPELPHIATCIAAPRSQNTQIYNNTFANAGSALAMWGNDGTEILEFKNNIVTGMRSAAIDSSMAIAEAGGWLAHTNNLYYANSADFGWAAGAYGENEFAANPKFASGGYTLDTGSPAINSGALLAGIAYQGSAPDLGAFETASAAPAPNAFLAGKVTANVSGHPAITRATISVGGVVLGATDDAGNYRIPVAAGTYSLTAARAGFISASGSVTVAAGATGTRNFDLAKNASSDTWYVNAATGNDSYNGQTPNTAWATINRGDVLGVLKPGDVVMVAGGTYEQSGIAAFLGVSHSKCFGEAAAPITYKADGIVKIDQAGIQAEDLTNRGFVIDASYIVLQQNDDGDEFNISGCQYGVVVETGRKSVTVANCRLQSIVQPVVGGGPTNYASLCAGVRTLGTGTTIRNCVAFLIGDLSLTTDVASAFAVSAGSGNKVYNNTVHYATTGLYVGAGATGTEFRNNIISQYAANAILSACPVSEFAHTNNLFQAIGDPGVPYAGSAVAGAYEFSVASYENDLVGFLNGDAGDYHLADSSVAINMGVNVGLPYLGPAPDLGAFETDQAGYPDQFAVLQGTVRYRSTGLPAAGVLVNVIGETATTVTGEDGTYAFVMTVPGNFVLEALKEGYAPKVIDIVLTLGQITTQDVYLSPGTGRVWDLAMDFSIAGNPNGPWSYLECNELDSLSATPLPNGRDAETYPGLVSWANVDTGAGFPVITVNSTDGVLLEYYPPHSAAIHPGDGGDNGSKYGIARWTAQTAGTYEVYTTFGDSYDTAATTDCHVMLNGDEVFAGVLDGSGGYVLPYVAKLDLSAGDYLDAFVGNNGAFQSDNTPIRWRVIGVDTIPANVANAAQAKSYADNKLVAFTTDQIVTVGTGTLSDTAVAYVEDADRTSGIKVVGASLTLGRKVQFQGYMGTDKNGERFITVTGSVTQNGTGTINSLGMLNKTVTGGAAGLLVRVWGTVTEVDAGGKFVILDDGSGVPIKVMKEATTKTMAPTKMVGVTGPASLVADGPTLTVVVRARSNNDIVSYN